MRDIKHTVLGEIVEQKKIEIAQKKQQHSIADLEQIAASKPKPRGFSQALQQKKPAIIAEIKKASPSKGVIREQFNPAEIAAQYQQAGAACMSVLTDVKYFQGDASYLSQAKASAMLPALRKDFMIDPYHIIESRALDADCILLIVACLSNQQLAELSQTAFEHGMDVLVEVHDEYELEQALQLPEQCLLGVNNRNLKTFAVDLNTSIRIKQQLSNTRSMITESGISRAEDIELMRKHGIDQFLVGESFMREQNPGEALCRLFGPIQST